MLYHSKRRVSTIFNRRVCVHDACQYDEESICGVPNLREVVFTVPKGVRVSAKQSLSTGRLSLPFSYNFNRRGSTILQIYKRLLESLRVGRACVIIVRVHDPCD